VGDEAEEGKRCVLTPTLRLRSAPIGSICDAHALGLDLAGARERIQADGGRQAERNAAIAWLGLAVL